MPPLTALDPGEGAHWQRLSAWLRDQIDTDAVDGIWVFRILRHQAREFGTAVVSRVEGDRRRIYTARFVATVKGKQRGTFEAWIDEVGSGPIEALHELLALVPVRAGDEEPPVPVALHRWFPPSPEPAAAGVDG